MIRPAQERLFGVVGRPVSHSLSPVMMNRAFKVTGLPCRYLAMEITDPAEDLEILARVGFEGLSVTVPYKETVMELVSSMDEDAEKIGAINTLKRVEGKWQGRNTDWLGVVKALEISKKSLKGKKALVIGAGGASRAVCYALKKMGIKTTLSNRTFEKAERLSKIFDCDVVGIDKLSTFDSNRWDIIINTTTVGMKEDLSIVPKNLLAPSVIAMDIVYTPLWTRFLREAKEAGCEIISGIEMLLYQGVFQFEWWFGIPAPVEEMRKALLERIKDGS